jgi:hypothetical protein
MSPSTRSFGHTLDATPTTLASPDVSLAALDADPGRDAYSASRFGKCEDENVRVRHAP